MIYGQTREMASSGPQHLEMMSELGFIDPIIVPAGFAFMTE
jgi:hypothetical protein